MKRRKGGVLPAPARFSGRNGRRSAAFFLLSAALLALSAALPGLAGADYSRGNLHTVSVAMTHTGFNGSPTATNDWHAIRFTPARAGTITSLQIRFAKAQTTIYQIWVAAVDPASPDNPQAGTVIASTATVSVSAAGFNSVGLTWTAAADTPYWLIMRDSSGQKNDANTPLYQQITSQARDVVQSDPDSDVDPNYLVLYSESDSPSFQTATQRQLIFVALYADEPYGGVSYSVLNNIGNVGGATWVGQFYKPESSFWTPRIGFYGKSVSATQPLYVDVYRDPLGANQYVATATAPV
ncbi:MAG: hypothetical protein RQ748_11720, partial [Elusimicrobiales bacterium]|nr:hypothetical protein [Elusimicrobiales bacterium]